MDNNMDSPEESSSFSATVPMEINLEESNYEGVQSDVCQEEVDDEPRSIILALISQLKAGMDLHKVTFPAFVLEPRSLLERITDFMSHQDIILNNSKVSDPLERFLNVVRYYLSGWHIQPKGVKKPYNPILGEYFRCKWECPDGSMSYYIAEQTCHHPPVSAYFMANPENGVIICGNFRPKSKFLGNSVVSYMEGQTTINLLDCPEEEYIVMNPNVYARGILVGSMYMELGDSVVLECPKTGFKAEILFKVKGYFTGSYNCIEGKIFDTKNGMQIYNISGKWSDKIFISSPFSDSPPVLFFDALNHPILPKIVPKEEDQDTNESRKLWSQVTKALLKKDYNLATDEKFKLEEDQRHFAQVRADNDLDWQPNFFRQQQDGQWVLIERNMFSEPRNVLDDHFNTLLKRHDFIHERKQHIKK